MIEYASSTLNADGHLFEYCDPSLWLSVVDAYQSQGVSTVPVDGKSPVLRGYQNRTRSYGQACYDYVESKYPYASCGILMEQNGLCVVDLDKNDPDFLIEALDVFGWTDLIVSTPRGFHLYYKSVPSLGQCSTKNIDLKAGSSAMVVAPGSIRDGVTYELNTPHFQELSEPRKLQRYVDMVKGALLPAPSFEGLERVFKARLLPANKEHEVSPRKATPNARTVSQVNISTKNILSISSDVLQGRRNNFLCRIGLKYSRECQGNLEAVIDRLSFVNADQCKPPMSDAKVDQVATWACKIEINGSNRIESRGKKKPVYEATIDPIAMAALKGKPRWKDALALYVALQQHNMPNEVFALAPSFVNKNIGRANLKDKNGHAAIKATLIEAKLIAQVGAPVKGKALARFAFFERANQIHKAATRKAYKPVTPNLSKGGAYNMSNEIVTHIGAPGKELPETAPKRAIKSTVVTSNNDGDTRVFEALKEMGRVIHLGDRVRGSHND